MRLLPLLFVATLLFLPLAATAEGLPEGVKNSQKPEDKPLTPAESLAKITVPEGFRATLFAGEPDVAQPIAMAFDDRGRLWVAECYSYKEWDKTKLDRILIFEDKNGDGQFDERKVFADGLSNLTSIQIGFGGVWACCAPELLFFPDRNRDDVPDGKPEVVLDGFDHGKVGHNIVNGLIWGPDGWLYGCHGIQADSFLGAPGTPKEQRAKLNCGVWRYHPTRKVAEAVAHGTTNPWGLDFDQHGEAFFVNCVIGHLWHLVPGAHYKRMYGNHYRENLYELIDACSDHLHWGGGAWTDSRGGKGKHSEAGGGHAHCGLAVYQGNNFPEQYRNAVFMGNIHGNRLNCDHLSLAGSGYVGKHGKDLFFANDDWFRPVAIICGPDGGMYIADWCDLGECHDNDGVHRTSGRIYKLVYQKPDHLAGLDLAKLTSPELVKLQASKSDWHARDARRLLQERAAAGDKMDEVQSAAKKLFDDTKDDVVQVRLLWTLYVVGGLSDEALFPYLAHDNLHVRAWAVRLIADDGKMDEPALDKLQAQAKDETAGLVRTHLAGTMRLMDGKHRLAMAKALSSRDDEAADTNLQLMVWYGLEPAVIENKAEALALIASTKWPKLRQFIARRVAGAAP